MGLDISHGAASWGYGSFNEFRRDLARHEGFDLDQMDGFAPLSVMMYPGTPWKGRSWNTVDTPLKPLLNHSDCDGELTPEECRQVAPRLREVIDALWPEGATEFWEDRCRTRGLSLAEAMERAAEAGENLEFH